MCELYYNTSEIIRSSTKLLALVTLISVPIDFTGLLPVTFRFKQGAVGSDKFSVFKIVSTSYQCYQARQNF